MGKFFSLIPYHKKQYFYFLLQSIFRWMNPLIHIIFLEKIVSSLTQNQSELFYNTLISYIFVILLYECIWFLSRKVWWVVTIPKSDTKIYDMYLQKFIQLDNNEIEKIWVGKIIAILENGRLRWAESLAWIMEKWIPLLLLFWYVFYITIHKAWYFFAGFSGLLLLSILVLVWVNNNQFKFRSMRSDLRNNRLRHVTKILMSKNEILQTWKIQKEIEKIEDFDNQTAQINIDMSVGRTLQNRVMPFFIGSALLIFIYIFWWSVLNGDFSLSEFVGITTVFLVINGSIMNFIWFYVDLTKHFIDIEKMWDFFENTPSIVWYDEWKSFEYKKWEIQFENMNYAYFPGKNVLENFSLHIEWWKITALVWASGSWKTTIVKLIAWYIKAWKWEIILDWQKLSEISLKSLYKNIWYLTQEPSVFDGSIEENLLYAVGDSVSDEQIKKAILDANCKFIYDLPSWLQTQIGERGVKLSWWQKQRLAIAKIMLKNPKIIILDEPTSALDSFSEEQITKAMRKLFEWRTVIVIAHRLQTVKHADKIIVLADGKVIEEGNHEELVLKKWQYAKMLELQSGF